jgi:hypothetical protein
MVLFLILLSVSSICLSPFLLIGLAQARVSALLEMANEYKNDVTRMDIEELQDNERRWVPFLFIEVSYLFCSPFFF